MRMAKVSPLYEGKLGKRSRAGVAEEEELGRSRRARIDAKARRQISRMNYRALLFPSNGKNILTNSSSMNSTSSSLEKEMENQMDYQDMYNAGENNTENEQKGTPPEVINVEDDENDITQEAINIIGMEKEQKFETETAAAALTTVEQNWENGWFMGCEDWPMIWTYEEEWLWWGKAPLGLGLGLGSNSINPQWEYISGVGWLQMKGE